MSECDFEEQNPLFQMYWLSKTAQNIGPVLSQPSTPSSSPKRLFMVWLQKKHNDSPGIAKIYQETWVGDQFDDLE